MCVHPMPMMITIQNDIYRVADNRRVILHRLLASIQYLEFVAER